MSKLENITKHALKKRGLPERLGNCPDELELSRYLDGRLSGQQKGQMETHLADCAYCLDLLVATKEILKEKRRRRQNFIKILKKDKWLIITFTSFLSSFFIKKFFLQFLFLSLILGIKWALGNEGSRNLVMIFRSLQHKDTEKNEQHRFSRQA